MKLPTQNDVARIVGVSRATVSYVLSGRQGGSIAVTEETRRRVLQAAQEVGYEPNAAALSLRLKKTHNVGITIPNINNPHMHEILCGAAQEAMQNGYNLLVFYSEMKPDIEKLGIRELLRGRIDGLILMPTYATDIQEEVEMLSSRRLPVVITTYSYLQFSDLDTIIPGHDLGAAELKQHLLGLGHRSIAFVKHLTRRPIGQERIDAYLKALQDAGILVHEDWIVETGETYQDGYETGLELFNRRSCPTAIVALNDVLAIGLSRAAIERGMRIPQDISIAGFDNNDYTAYTNPPLTTVNVNAREIGAQAVQLVLKRISNPERPFEHLHIPYEFVIRASTGPAPCEVLVQG